MSLMLFYVMENSLGVVILKLYQEHYASNCNSCKGEAKRFHIWINI